MLPCCIPAILNKDSDTEMPLQDPLPNPRLYSAAILPASLDAYFPFFTQTTSVEGTD